MLVHGSQPNIQKIRVTVFGFWVKMVIKSGYFPKKELIELCARIDFD